ncbi:MAG: hypothetical protein DRP35_06750, partial [Candidatus Zixiibacteriota bacterium]
MKKNLKTQLLYLLLMFVFISSPKTEIISTNYYKDIFGKVTLNDVDAPEGTLIQVFDLAGNLRGKVVTEDEGFFGPMQSFLPNDEIVNLNLLQFQINGINAKTVNRTESANKSTSTLIEINLEAECYANDFDCDGILDSEDNCPESYNPEQTDSDQDGVGNFCDNSPYGTTLKCDTQWPDFDGICANVDNCPTRPNADQADSDNDGIGDVCDICPNDTINDPDGDRICGEDDDCPYVYTPTCPECITDRDGDGFGNVCDNCEYVFNPEQIDTDDDGIGDICDNCLFDYYNDADGDGICGNVDNCPFDNNPEQIDTDGDKIGDLCDECPNDSLNDGDQDGICANIDNCPTLPNANQTDFDNDGIGDACDNCPKDFNPDQIDNDGDGRGALCDCNDNDPENIIVVWYIDKDG